MRSTRTSRGVAALAAGGFALTLALSACTPPPGDDGGESEDGGGGDVEVPEGCEDYAEFIELGGGDLDGTEVTVYTTITGDEATAQEDSYVRFEECTGIDVVYEASDEFEAQIAVRIQSGAAPDLAYIPQPGLLQRLIQDFPDAILPAPESVEAKVDEFFTPEWKEYGTVDGTFYAAPLGANAKSFVWYSPAMFEEAGYEIPQTWDELIALSDRIVQEHPDTKPWCAGIASGDATGWPATDWLEDVVLRTAGPDVYDQWYTHEIPFNDPAILEALEGVGSILKNPAYVNGGLGDVSTIATTDWDAGGFPILDGDCWMHRAANFYGVNWQQVREDVTIGEDGDVFAFYLPSANEDKPMLGGGEFVAAFDDRPEVVAFQTYLASDVWANDKAKVSNAGWVSANSGLDTSLLQSPIDQLASEILASDEYTFRFDASDLMPGPVGAGSFWQEMTAWIANDKPSAEVLDAIESSWPTD